MYLYFEILFLESFSGPAVSGKAIDTLRELQAGRSVVLPCFEVVTVPQTFT